VLLRFDSVKNGEKFLPLNKIQKTVRKMIVSEDVLRLANNTGSPRIDHADDWGEEEFLPSLGKIVNIYLGAELIFF